MVCSDGFSNVVFYTVTTSQCSFKLFDNTETFTDLVTEKCRLHWSTIRMRPRVSIATTCGAGFFFLLQARALVGQHIPGKREIAVPLELNLIISPFFSHLLCGPCGEEAQRQGVCLACQVRHNHNPLPSNLLLFTVFAITITIFAHSCHRLIILYSDWPEVVCPL